MLDGSCDVRDAQRKILLSCFIRIKGSLLGILPVGVVQGIRLLGSSSMQQTRVIADFCDGGYSYGFNT